MGGQGFSGSEANQDMSGAEQCGPGKKEGNFAGFNLWKKKNLPMDKLVRLNRQGVGANSFQKERGRECIGEGGPSERKSA